MCGIAGIIGKHASENTLADMLRAQSHRGPDAEGKFFDPGFAAIGHNRLAIIDLSANANQPFFDASGRFALIFNGEIYNYIELREALSPHYDFTTQSDTEVLLAAWIIWGKAALHQLNGMFSFAIWDNQSKSLFAARDRFGVKPFCYSVFGGMLYFASEIKTLHAAGIPKKPNQKVWASYLAFGSYGMPDETFWQQINQLPAAHCLEFTAGDLKISRWYDFVAEVKKQPAGLSYEESKAYYISLLKDSIKLRFRADVPVGFNISGGLDSSVLLALVNDSGNGTENVSAYTFYTGNRDYDELLWVETMVRKTANPLKKVLLDAGEVPALAAQIAFYEDEPYGGIPTLAYAKLFEKARSENVKVVLDGQGMDEQWAGYDYYLKQNDATIQGIVESPYKINVLSESLLKLAERPRYPEPFGNALQNKQYRDLFFTKIPRALRFNDRISMAFSTELREPFLDYRLVEFAFSRPDDFKIGNGITKRLLRDIASEYLSDDLACAPKRALQTPQREWLGGELADFVFRCISEIERSPCADWFNIAELKQEWQRYLDGKNESAFHLWQWISAALYCSDEK